MKYPVKGFLIKTYVTLEYLEARKKRTLEIELNEAMSQANEGSLILAGRTISIEEVMSCETHEKNEDIMIVATRISYNANVEITKRHSQVEMKEQTFNQDDGATYINKPQLMYEIVKSDGSPKLCYDIEIKFDVNSLKKQL